VGQLLLLLLLMLTLSQIIGKDSVSQMETYFGDVLNLSALNLMNINITKTKEMIVGANINPPPQLIFNDEIIERVLVYKLLGVLIDTNLKWDNHIDSICSKASLRLHFLTQLKAKRCNSQRYGPFLRNGD